MRSVARLNEIAYMTSKVFPDGSQEIRIKRNKEITQAVIEKALRTKKRNKEKREWRNKKLISDFLKIPFYARDYEYKKQLLEYELQIKNIENVVRSARRARQALYDICRCNDFEYFVTWTFDPEKVERLNDDIVKRKFTQFQNYLRKMFPNMYYIAVPEYHEKGGLHFHLLVGGVTMEELKAVPARYIKRKGRHKNGDLIFKNKKQIFNVERWKLGYSTLSVIENGEAAKHYVCKYITKQNLDKRFFGKKRYYVSKNIRRPDIEKWTEAVEHCLDKIDLNMYLVSYADINKKFAVFTNDGNGIYNPELNSDETKKRVSLLCGAAKQACDIAAPRDSASAYSTIRTLNRKSLTSAEWRYMANKTQRAFFRTLRNFRPLPEDFNYLKCEEQAILDEYYASMAVKPCEKIIDNEQYCKDIGLLD